MSMDRKVATLIALLAREYRYTAANALAELDKLEGEGFSDEELAGLAPDEAAHLHNLAATRKGIEGALVIVDEGVSALSEMLKP